MKQKTRLVHPPQVTVPPENRPLVAPIHQSVKFEHDTVAGTLAALRGEKEGFFYSRSANPTTRMLERTLAGLQGRDDAIVCASGVGAIAQVLFGLLKSGDHVLCFVETYAPTRSLIRRQLARFGVRHTMLSIEDDAGIERVLAGTPTRLVIFESPTNPVNRIADIAHITRLARAHGALTVLDNTLAGLHQHGDTDVDLFVHSLTKYASGHGDVMGGAVIGSKELIAQLRPEFTHFGGTLDPHAAWLIQRGLKTYQLRYEAQSATAMEVARFLESHPKIERVHYAGLPGHPRHALAARQMRHFGTIVSFDLRAGRAAGDRLADALRLFAIAASMGSPESLVIPPGLMGPCDLPPELAALSGLAPGTVRLSMGLEDPADLIDDLTQALEKV
ncbi:MAG: PLP-dependent aspartate aminotransferase family protein [Pseudomonadota bacterium]|jgi:cystathionine beta-lyase/cystathionine gamma-synthase|nr:MAG: methionine gamma-lyase [Pseudomonadota bacterium]